MFARWSKSQASMPTLNIGKKREICMHIKNLSQRIKIYLSILAAIISREKARTKSSRYPKTVGRMKMKTNKRDVSNNSRKINFFHVLNKHFGRNFCDYVWTSVEKFCLTLIFAERAVAEGLRSVKILTHVISASPLAITFRWRKAYFERAEILFNSLISRFRLLDVWL